MNSQKIALIATLSALSIGTNYAMISFSNVKLMDLIVFVGGFCFGPIVGSLIGILSWAVYGTLNPLGFSLPIWLATMFSESVYGIAGALMKRGVKPRDLNGSRNWRIRIGIFFGVLGFLLTFVYDLITNVVFGYVGSSDVTLVVIFGFVTFGVIHMLSNAIFFGVGCLPTINAILRAVGSEDLGLLEK